MSSPSRALEIRVGAFTLAALLILAGFYLVVGNPVFGPGVHLKLEYAFSGPIKPGATIKVSGVNVGKVDRVEFVGSRPRDAGADYPLVRLHVFIEQRAAPLLTQGTRFYVTTLGVLGEHYVDILPGPADGALIEDGATVRGVDLPRTDLLMARMAQMVDQVGRVLETNDVQLEHLLTAATQLMKQADVLLKDHDVGSLLQDAASTMTEVRGLLASTRKALKDPEQLAAMVSDGKVMMGDMQGLIKDMRTEVPNTITNANKMLGQAEQLTVRVDNLLRALEKAGLTDEKKLQGLVQQGETVMERADRISARADTILTRLEKGEGTAGKLMKDDSVYNDLKALLSDIRANPWKLMIPGRSKDPPKKDGE